MVFTNIHIHRLGEDSPSQSLVNLFALKLMIFVRLVAVDSMLKSMF